MLKVDMLLRYGGAMSGAIAVLSFLVLPVVQKSFLWIDASRNGTWLIQTVIESSGLEGGLIGFALVTTLLATGASALLFLWNRFKHGSICAQSALALMAVLMVYFVVKTGSSDGLAIGFWISFLALAVMSALSLRSFWSPEKAVIVKRRPYRRQLPLISRRSVRTSRPDGQEMVEEQAKTG